MAGTHHRHNNLNRPGFVGGLWGALDEADLVARLDHCLLRAEELDGGPTAWDQLGDPFPDWDDSCPLT